MNDWEEAISFLVDEEQLAKELEKKRIEEQLAREAEQKADMAEIAAIVEHVKSEHARAKAIAAKYGMKYNQRSGLVTMEFNTLRDGPCVSEETGEEEEIEEPVATYVASSTSEEDEYENSDWEYSNDEYE